MKNYQQIPFQYVNFKKLAFHALASITFTFYMQNANSVEFSKRAIVTANVEHDSNPALSENNEDPVWIYSLSPQVQLSANNELNRWFVDGALLIQRYSNDRTLVEREDPKFTLGWDRTYESGLFGIRANYQENTSRTSELTATGVFNDKNGTQKTKSVEARWEHAINARWTILNEAIYGDYKFTDAGGLSSYSVSELRSRVTFANTEKLNTYTQLGYLHYKPEQQQQLDNTDFVRLNVGADYQLTETFNYGANIGAYKVSGQQSDTGWEAALRTKYDSNERISYFAELSRSLGAGGVGGFQKSDALKLSGIYIVSATDAAGVDYSLNKSKQDSQINVVAVDYQQLGVFYERKLSNKWQARLTAAHKQVDSSSADARANIIGIALIYDTLSF